MKQVNIEGKDPISIEGKDPIFYESKQQTKTAVEWFANAIKGLDTAMSFHYFEDKIQQAKEIEKQQRGYSEEEVLELIQFLAEKEDFKEHSSMSIFIAKDYLNQFKNK